MKQTASTRGAWYTVALLVLLYCGSFLDRNILPLLATPVAAALGISNTQIGLLYGLGFGVLYALVGLPLAHWIDRGQRIWIVFIGVMLWSACTVASAFAGSFAELALLRSGVALGEAVLTPSAISIIADLFARERRTLPTAVYNSVGTLMGYGAYFVGGGALDLATHLSPIVGMAPWRLTLVVVGLPGLLLAPLLRLSVREPRRMREPGERENYTTVAQGVGYLLQHFRLYGFMFLGIGAVTTALFGFVSWLPTLLVRAYGETPAHAGYLVGSIAAVGGVSGAIFWPLASTTWMKRGRADAPLLLLALGAVLVSGSVLLGGLSRTEWVAILTSGTMAFGASTLSLLVPLVIQYVAPSQMRARLMAFALIPTSLIGMSMGPLLVAALSEHVFSGVFALASGMATVAVLVAPLGVTFMLSARRGYFAALAGLQV
jgi:MFS family permease